MGPNACGVRRQQQRSGGRQQLGFRPAREHRRIGQQAHRRGRRHGEHAVRRLHHAASDVDRRHDHAIHAQAVEGVHGADDVDDRVERADLVQVHLLDRHLMNRGFSDREPLEERLCAVLPRRGQCRAVDERGDLRQAAVRVMVLRRLRLRRVLVRMLVRVVVPVVVVIVVVVRGCARPWRPRLRSPETSSPTRRLAARGRPRRRSRRWPGCPAPRAARRAGPLRRAARRESCRRRRR